MIRDLSDTLDAFFNQPGLPPDLQNAQTSFERPTEPFEPGQPTINLFLLIFVRTSSCATTSPSRGERVA